MNRQFLLKLKATLDALISENQKLKAQVAALNHSVNDVIIGGLKDAAAEYEDNENYSVFVDTYQDKYSPLVDASKLLYGDDYDIASELYESSKGQEDVASFVDEQIKALQSKLDALYALKNGSGDSVLVVEDDGSADEAELERIAKDFLL